MIFFLVFLRFQKLNLPCLQAEISSAVKIILQHYISELEGVRKVLCSFLFTFRQSQCNPLPTLVIVTDINDPHVLSSAVSTPQGGSSSSQEHATHCWKNTLGQAVVPKDTRASYVYRGKYFVDSYWTDWHLFNKIVLRRWFFFFAVQENSDILSSQEGKDVIKMYNKTASTLVEFEILYHRSWMRDVSQLQYGKSHHTVCSDI